MAVAVTRDGFQQRIAPLTRIEWEFYGFLHVGREKTKPISSSPTETRRPNSAKQSQTWAGWDICGTARRAGANGAQQIRFRGPAREPRGNCAKQSQFGGSISVDGSLCEQTKPIWPGRAGGSRRFFCETHPICSEVRELTPNLRPLALGLSCETKPIHREAQERQVLRGKGVMTNRTLKRLRQNKANFRADRETREPARRSVPSVEAIVRNKANLPAWTTKSRWGRAAAKQSQFSPVRPTRWAWNPPLYAGYTQLLRRTQFWLKRPFPAVTLRSSQP